MNWTPRLNLAVLIIFGVSACSLVGPKDDNLGKRTFGTQLDDRRSAKLIMQNLKAANPEVKSMNLAVTVFNGVALLTGQANTEAVKTQAGKIAGQIRNVAKVHNEIEVAGPTALLVRSNDGLLKTKIRVKMSLAPDVDADRIKVVVENGVVYLMGLLTRDEATAAVSLTREVYGVQKIIQAFEFLN
jgi:osmotically-inducible protein OsmY